MATHINNVLKQAILTFTSKSELFAPNLNALSNLLEKITAEDVNLQPQFATESLWSRPGKAPVTCIDIYEDENLTMGIFILKPGGNLPLHNHPEMYGLIKVISGKVKITSYSLNTPKTLEVDRRSFMDDHPTKLFSRKNIVTAELVSSEILDTSSKPCMLEPNEKNLHEIESVDGPAAFLDILAPPYGTMIPNNGPRLCSYFAVLNQGIPVFYNRYI
ncbi:unnamed protein product [Acanthoscelides obtectus]|uniref:2-aminoethanethiol dioxygenase n=1 Tax=Acanthoscelides obtectus TaxID=200917 RepID=A0A9P0PWL1_ACAOB|nr:unnamed protein product [Acanthoscelides obtectus]CAK1668246.1 2-aminoethanethiol dioxygenase [Acanthoscelides obtectus]